jgi:hypothetical protein
LVGRQFVEKFSPVSQDVPGGTVSILGGHSTSHSKQKSVYVHVLFRMFSKIELFHCTVPKLLIRKILRTVSNTCVYCSSDKVGTVYLI